MELERCYTHSRVPGTMEHVYSIPHKHPKTTHTCALSGKGTLVVPDMVRARSRGHTIQGALPVAQPVSRHQRMLSNAAALEVMHRSIPNGHPNHRSHCSNCGNHARATSLIPRRRDERHKGVRKLFPDLRLVSRRLDPLAIDGLPTPEQLGCIGRRFSCALPVIFGVTDDSQKHCTARLVTITY